FPETSRRATVRINWQLRAPIVGACLRRKAAVNVRKCAHMVFRRCAELSLQEIIDEEPPKWVRHTFTRKSIRTRMAIWKWATAIASIGSAAELLQANQQ